MEDLKTVTAALSGMDVPGWVVDHSVSLFEDSHGDLSAKVRFVVSNEQLPVLKDGNALSALRRRVHETMKGAGIFIWPYVDFVAEFEAA